MWKEFKEGHKFRPGQWLFMDRGGKVHVFQQYGLGRWCDAAYSDIPAPTPGKYSDRSKGESLQESDLAEVAADLSERSAASNWFDRAAARAEAAADFSERSAAVAAELDAARDAWEARKDFRLRSLDFLRKGVRRVDV